MKNEELRNEFIKLLEENNDENTYQKFLEKHTQLLPTDTFRLNHGVHCSLIFSKMPIGNSKISDFCYITKSSAEWNIVFIEIEKPNTKFYNKYGTMNHDFNTGYQQIYDWITYFDTVENQLAFKKIPVINKILSGNPTMYENRINFKFILVLGRRKDLINSKFYKKRTGLCSDKVQILTYDSLCENLNQKYEEYICRMKNDCLYIDSEKFIDDQVFEWTDCTNIKIKQSVYNELKLKWEKYKKYENSKCNFMWDDKKKKLMLLKENIFK